MDLADASHYQRHDQSVLSVVFYAGETQTAFVVTLWNEGPARIPWGQLMMWNGQKPPSDGRPSQLWKMAFDPQGRELAFTLEDGKTGVMTGFRFQRLQANEWVGTRCQYGRDTREDPAHGVLTPIVPTSLDAETIVKHLRKLAPLQARLDEQYAQARDAYNARKATPIMDGPYPLMPEQVQPPCYVANALLEGVPTARWLVDFCRQRSGGNGYGHWDQFSLAEYKRFCEARDHQGDPLAGLLNPIHVPNAGPLGGGYLEVNGNVVGIHRAFVDALKPSTRDS